MLEPRLEKQRVNEKNNPMKIIDLYKSYYLFEDAAGETIGFTGLHFISNTLQKNKQYS
jgi:hypothetical protein